MVLIPISYPHHSHIHAIPYFLDGMICGPHQGSFPVRDHLRSGIIYGPGIICAPVHTSPFTCSVHKSKCLLVHITKLRPVGGLELETSRHFFRKGDKFEKLSRTFEGKFTLYNLDSIPILLKQKCLIIFQKI